MLGRDARTRANLAMRINLPTENQSRLVPN